MMQGAFGRLTLGPVIALGLLATAPGCGESENEVRVYTARIDPPAPPITGQAAAPLSAPAAAPSPVLANAGSGGPRPQELAWTLPAEFGFRDTGESNQFRLTTLRAGDPNDPDAALEVAVSRVPGAAGTITGNVNRWRQQLGLPPLTQEQVVPVVDYANNEAVPGFFTRIEAENGEAATMIAWFQLEDASWFLKANGTPEALDTHREGFEALVASVRRNPETNEDPHAGHDHPPEPASAPPPPPAY